jgi:staphyloferrin B biosynthesis citrate synthase
MADPGSRPSPSCFRQRFVARELLTGTFIKTPTSHAIEIVGALGFDFVVIDEEHAPFDPQATDVALLAARASGTAGIVRVPSASPADMLRVLDGGAVGVLVPHVSSVAKARDVAAACRYRNGKRGYSGSSRAGGYGGSKVWDHVARSDEATTVIAMIEDPEALEDIDAILAVEGLDGAFIGRGDLTVALGSPANDAPPVKAAVDRVLAAAGRARKPVCVMVGSAAEAQSFRESFREIGASAFIVSSDQGFLRKIAGQTLTEMAALGG